MLYAHILHDDAGYSVIYSVNYKLSDFGKKELVDTLFEETSDLVLLDKTIVKWKEAHGVGNLSGFQDFSGAGVELSAEKLVEFLRIEIHRLSKILEEDRQEKLKQESLLRKACARIFEYETVIDFQKRDIQALELELQKSDVGEDGEEALKENIPKIVYH